MAAKKKKAKKGSRPAKAKKAPAKKTKASKRPAKKTKKTGKKSVKAAAKKAPAKKAPKAGKKTAKRKQTKGEGDYAASRSFLKDQSSFVEKNRGNIPAMGREAEEALDGPEGGSLRDAEATAAARSRDTF